MEWDLLRASLLHAPGWWGLALAAIFLIGVTKSGFGSGVGLMIVPMMALAMAHVPGRGEKAALGLLLPLLMAGDLIAVWQYRRLFSLKVVRKLLPATAAGVVAGGIILRLIHEQQERVAGGLIRVDIGLESVALVALHWWRQWKAAAPRADAAGNPPGPAELPAYVPKAWHDHVVGASAGVSSTLAHAAGPIVAVYLLPQKMERTLFVGTCAIYFFLLNAAKLPVYAFNGLFKDASTAFALQFLPVVIAGALFGVWLNRRLNDRLFSRVVYVLTFLMGAYILFDGVRQLLRA